MWAFFSESRVEGKQDQGRDGVLGCGHSIARLMIHPPTTNPAPITLFVMLFSVDLVANEEVNTGEVMSLNEEWCAACLAARALQVLWYLVPWHAWKR